MMADNKLSSKEIVERGKRLYDEHFRTQMERDRHGEFFVIDVQSGDYEVASRDMDAALRFLDRRPDAVLYGIRIGDEVAYRFGIQRVLGAR